MSHFASLISLGCAKNLVDSETMIPQILSLGYVMTLDPTQASLIVVNTCGFLESAVEETIEVVLESAAHKISGSCRYLVVTGCMVQRYGKKLVDLLPEVDLFLGTSHYHELAHSLKALLGEGAPRLYIAQPRYIPTSNTPRTLSTAPGSAYLKIAEGCSNRCSFCLIPHLRGPYRSRTVEDVRREAFHLAELGVKEINLIAQDTTAFGLDQGKHLALLDLLEALDRLEGIEWIRLLYVYPDRLDASLLHLIAQSKKMVPYLDIPIQHNVPRILKAMRRDGASGGRMEELIHDIRFHIPEVVLRTSLMVGFPGETEKDFESLLQFVERVEMERVGVFAFSAEVGSPAAKLPSQVDRVTKEKRRHVLLEAQRSISRRLMQRYVGRVLPVLIEGVHPETEFLLSGRLPMQAPEVDGRVMITSGIGSPGQIMRARITVAHDYDVEAELVATE